MSHVTHNTQPSLLFVRFAGGAVRLAACAFCWPKDKSRVVKGWGCCCMLVLCGMAQGGRAGGWGEQAWPRTCTLSLQLLPKSMEV